MRKQFKSEYVEQIYPNLRRAGWTDEFIKYATAEPRILEVVEENNIPIIEPFPPIYNDEPREIIPIEDFNQIEDGDKKKMKWDAARKRFIKYYLKYSKNPKHSLFIDMRRRGKIVHPKNDIPLHFNPQKEDVEGLDDGTFKTVYDLEKLDVEKKIGKLPKEKREHRIKLKPKKTKAQLANMARFREFNKLKGRFVKQFGRDKLPLKGSMSMDDYMIWLRGQLPGGRM